MTDHNALRWDGGPGHYEVYYLTLTDPATGTGAWIRYTMLAPDAGGATCSLWCCAMDLDGGVLGRKTTFPADRLEARSDPFRLAIGDATLDGDGARGAFDDVAWDLRWESRLPGREHVHPLLQRLGVAKTILVLPHPDLSISGTLRLGDRTLELSGVRGGQAHLWGSKHAGRWAWAHCNEFRAADGEPQDGAFVDGASVIVPRLGRDVGPSTPLIGRFLGDDFAGTSPLQVMRTSSRFALTTWSFEAVDGKRRIVGEVDAPRETLVGVTYTDPDGDQAYCYNSEVASMRLSVLDRRHRGAGWKLRQTLIADGTAHFEYAQREPVAALDLHVR